LIFCAPKVLNFVASKINLNISFWFFKFVINVSGGHCDCLSWAPKHLSTTLSVTVRDSIRQMWHLVSNLFCSTDVIEWAHYSIREMYKIVLNFTVFSGRFDVKFKCLAGQVLRYHFFFCNSVHYNLSSRIQKATTEQCNNSKGKWNRNENVSCFLDVSSYRESNSKSSKCIF
jgi:hypothetical protein